MTGEVQETREQEVARVRSYLASQSLRRSNEQLLEALQQAHQQFIVAVNSVPNHLVHTSPREGEWSIIDVILHMRAMAALDLASISSVLKDGRRPGDIQDILTPAPQEATRAGLLAELDNFRNQLSALILPADPSAHLDITWSHSEFGAMHWREWLLFARVHTLDHTRQAQSISEALVKMPDHKGNVEA